MSLTKEEYDYLKEYIPTIKHVATGGNTRKSDAWYAMNTMEIQRTGLQLNGAGCEGCMVEQYQRYWNLIQEYETNIFNLTNNN